MTGSEIPLWRIGSPQYNGWDRRRFPMQYKFVDISELKSYPTPRERSPEEEAAIIAQYKAERTIEALEADYQNIDNQLAESIPAEQLLSELQE
jgi:hypothetical protein